MELSDRGQTAVWWGWRGQNNEREAVDERGDNQEWPSDQGSWHYSAWAWGRTQLRPVYWFSLLFTG